MEILQKPVINHWRLAIDLLTLMNEKKLSLRSFSKKIGIQKDKLNKIIYNLDYLLTASELVMFCQLLQKPLDNYIQLNTLIEW